MVCRSHRLENALDRINLVLQLQVEIMKRANAPPDPCQQAIRPAREPINELANPVCGFGLQSVNGGLRTEEQKSAPLSRNQIQIEALGHRCLFGVTDQVCSLCSDCSF